MTKRNEKRLEVRRKDGRGEGKKTSIQTVKQQQRLKMIKLTETTAVLEGNMAQTPCVRGLNANMLLFNRCDLKSSMS